MIETSFIYLDESVDSTTTDEKISMWVKEEDILKPSTNITIHSKLIPGMYTIDYSRESGIFCKKLNYLSDELFTFSDSVTIKLLEQVEDFWNKKDIYLKNNLIHKRGILLEGYPGTGKSSIISLLSEQIINKGGVVFKVSGLRNLSLYVEFLQHAFRKIEPDTNIVTIIEDLDDYAETEEPLIVDFLDGKLNINHHLVVATTNNSKDIPDSFLRPSRIDLKIEIPLPSEKNKREYFKFKNVPDSEVEDLIKASEGFSMADLKELYICMYILGYNLDEACNKINNFNEKKDYSNFSRSSETMQL